MRQFLHQGPDGQIGIGFPADTASGQAAPGVGLHKAIAEIPSTRRVRDERPMMYLNMTANNGNGTSPYLDSLFRDDFPGQGGYQEGFNYLTGVSAHLRGFDPTGPNLGFVQPFDRFMIWQPLGQLGTNPVGTFTAAPYLGVAPQMSFLHKMYRDAASYVKNVLGHKRLTLEGYAGMAVPNTGGETTIGADRLYNPNLDPWFNKSLRMYRDDWMNGTWYLDAGGFGPFMHLAKNLQQLAPCRVAYEAIPQIGLGASSKIDVEALATGPGWSEYQNYKAQDDSRSWVAPPAPYHECIVVVAQPIYAANHAADLAELISLLNRGFVLGAGNASDAGLFYPTTLVQEAYAAVGKPWIWPEL